MKSNNKKEVCFFISKVFIVRTDLTLLQSEQQEFILIASKAVLARLPEKQKKCFSHIVESSFTEEALEAEISSVIKQRNIDINQARIVTNDEYSLLTAAKLREKLGIQGARYESVELFINKLKMKQKVSQQGIRLPKYLSFKPEEYAQNKQGYVEKIQKALGTNHIFAKPVDSVGSQNVAEIKTLKELENWCESHKNEKNYELDEFLDGDLYHVDSLVKDGKILSFEVCIYAYPNADFVKKDKPFASRVIHYSEETYKQLAEFNQKVLEALSPVPDGATHHEIFRKNNGELVFLEIAARPAGGFIPNMYEKHSGYNMEENHFRLQMGLPIKQPIPVKERNCFAAWLWYPRRAGNVAGLNKDFSMKSTYEFQHTVKVGDSLTAPETLRDYMATLLMYSDDYNKVKEDFLNLKDFNPVNVVSATINNNATTAVKENKETHSSSIFSNRSMFFVAATVGVAAVGLGVLASKNPTMRQYLGLK